MTARFALLFCGAILFVSSIFALPVENKEDSAPRSDSVIALLAHQSKPLKALAPSKNPLKCYFRDFLECSSSWFWPILSTGFTLLGDTPKMGCGDPYGGGGGYYGFMHKRALFVYDAAKCDEAVTKMNKWGVGTFRRSLFLHQGRRVRGRVWADTQKRYIKLDGGGSKIGGLNRLSATSPPTSLPTSPPTSPPLKALAPSKNPLKCYRSDFLECSSSWFWPILSTGFTLLGDTPKMGCGDPYGGGGGYYGFMHKRALFVYDAAKCDEAVTKMNKWGVGTFRCSLFLHQGLRVRGRVWADTQK